jgi:hypothetical protein
MAAPILGLVCPGRPLRTDFTISDASKLVLDVPAPRDVSSVCVFILPGASLPPGTGVAVFWALPPYSSFTALGALTPETPSAVWSTGWASTPEIQAAPSIRIGVSLETLDVCLNLNATQAGAREARVAGFAQLVANDVGNFLGSFAQVTPQGERLVIPPTALGVWLRRVEERFRADPEFLRREDKH